jgi:hypothetical protein
MSLFEKLKDWLSDPALPWKKWFVEALVQLVTCIAAVHVLPSKDQ